MEQLQNQGIIPLYIQLSDKIHGQIEQGIVKYGNQIPSEAQMCQDYEVSRVTVRKAVGLLVDAGVLIKRQGKGTYVAFPEFVDGMLKAETGSFTDAFSQTHLATSTKIISTGVVGASAVVAKRLHLAENERVIRIRRLRYVSQIPAVFEEDFFSLSFDFLLQMDLNNLSLYSLIHKKTGLLPKSAQSVFLAKLANVELAEWLDVARSEALLHVCQLVTNDKQDIIYYNEQTIRSDVYKYVVRYG